MSDINPQIKSQLLKYTQGGSGHINIAALAKHLNVSPTFVSRQLHVLGFSKKTHAITNNGRYIPRTEEFWGPVYENEYLKGDSLYDLEERYGISATTISRILKSLNFTIKDLKTAFKEQGAQSKRKKTNINRYGVEYPAQSADIQQKMRDTTFKRMGVVHNSQSLSFKDAHKRAGARLGVDHVLQSSEVIHKRNDTIYKKKTAVLISLLGGHGYKLLDEYTGTQTESYTSTREGPAHKQYQILHDSCGLIFKDDLFALPRCPDCFPLTGTQRSQLEQYYVNFIESLGFSCVANSRDVLQNHITRRWYELDIYIPEHNVAFEVNGLYYHSCHNLIEESRRKSPSYHANKTFSATLAGIPLYHIWEHDNPGIIKSMIVSILGKSKSVFARKLKVVIPDKQVAHSFFRNNHLHGTTPALLFMALEDLKGNLVSVISFRKTLKQGEIEIARFASLLNTSVVGGFSRLLSHSSSQLKNKGFTSLLTYCDRDWTPHYINSTYNKRGFLFVDDTGPIMKYTNFKQVFPRQKFQKHKLPSLFPDTFNPALTEQQNLSAVGIYPLYNSGNWKFTLPL